MMEIFFLNQTSEGDEYLLPEPYLPDIELKRINHSLEEKLAVISAHCLQCVNDSDIHWTDRTTSVMFYALPLLLTFGLLSGLFNFCVCLRQLNTSSYCVYLLGLVIASNCVLITGWTLRLEDYMEHSDSYQYIYPYFRGLHSWFWYASVWMLISMLLERFSVLLSSTTKNKRPDDQLFTPLQAGIITVLIFLVSSISAMPQFWEYQVTEIRDISRDVPRRYYQKSNLGRSIGYRIVYFLFQLAVSLFLPYPLMIIILVMLARSSKSSQQQHNVSEMSSSVQRDGSTVLNKEIKSSDKTVFTRMLVIFTVLYLVTTTPLSLLNIVDHINPHSNWTDDKLYFALNDLFQFFFYSFYSMQIIVFFCFSKDLKHLAVAIFGWCTNFKCAWKRVPPELAV